MAENYNRCEKCGTTYMDEGKGCPNCGAREGGAFNEIQTVKRQGLFYRFDSIKEYVAVIVIAIFAVGLAVYNFNGVNSISETRAYYEAERVSYDYKVAEYQEELEEYESNKSTGKYTSAQIAEIEDRIREWDDYIEECDAYFAKGDAYFNFADIVCALYITFSVLFILSAVMMVVRLKFSFKVSMVVWVLYLVMLTVTEICGIFVADVDIEDISLYGRLALGGAILSILYRFNIAVAVSEKTTLKPTAVAVYPAAAGVPMPTVKELNSDLDSFMAQQPTSASAEEIPADMASVAPVGRAEPTERDRMFMPTEVQPTVQPVMPLAERTAEVGSAADAVTALENPMIPVEMMEDETMPDAAPRAEESAPAAQPVQQPSAKGIWFCSGCGSLNENGNFCVSCGRKRD